MTIRDIPRFGERLRMIEEAWLREEGRALPVPALYGQGFTLGIVAGVEWASEQDDREPSDAEVLCECGFSEDLHDGEFDAACGAFRPDREPSEESVEKAAIAIGRQESCVNPKTGTWYADVRKVTRDRFRGYARAALLAAQGGATC